MASQERVVFPASTIQLLTVLFIGLKLTHVITWSWWWVLGPLWIPLALLALLGVFFLLMWGVVASASHYRRQRNMKAKGLRLSKSF